MFQFGSPRLHGGMNLGTLRTAIVGLFAVALLLMMGRTAVVHTPLLLFPPAIVLLRGPHLTQASILAAITTTISSKLVFYWLDGPMVAASWFVKNRWSVGG